MDKQTLKALKGSIKKWEKIVDGTGFDEGTENCPLCEMFSCDFCEGCPIQEKTKKDSCSATPYQEWYEVFESDPAYENNFVGIYEWGRLSSDELKKEAIKAAKKMLDFLKKLLPKGSKVTNG